MKVGKLFLSALAVLTMVLSSVAMAADPLEDCGYFNGALSTRDACSGSGGIITFSGSANIYNNPDTALATCTVSTPPWVLAKTQTCDSADCTAIPGNTKSASITYNLAPTSASLSSDPSTFFDTDEIVSADTTLTDYGYDVVTFDYHTGTTATFDPSNDDENLTINQITNAWKVRFAVDEDIKIGSIASATYSPPFELITTTTPQNIEIKTVDFKDGSTINLKASSSISMETFSVGRGGSSVTLEAPTITINSLTVSNYGSGIATIRLKADAINLGTLDMMQGAIVIVEPYTAGGNVTYKGNSITASSSSTMRLSSGDYYTDSLNIPGTSNASSIIAKDASSLINLYINGNFAPGNNPGINSDGNNGNFGSLPTTTMRIFVNGDFNTGGGGTTVNALMYVEGDVSLGNPSYIRGAISAKHSIAIGEGSKIYYDNNITDEIYAPCIVPIEAPSQDICYDTVTYQGMFCVDMGVFQGGMNCKQTIPLRNVSNENLTNVDAYINTSGFSGNFLSDCGVDGASGNCEKTSAINLGPIGIFSSSIAYDLPDFDDNETHSIYEKALMSMSIFSGTNLYATYKKDGVYYVSQIAACDERRGVYPAGPFDTWDTFRSVSDRNISTKIVSKNFNLTIASLNAANTTLEAKATGIKARYRLIDTNTGEYKTAEAIFDANASSSITSSEFNVSSAIKNVKVEFKYCADYNGSHYTLKPDSNCSAECSPETLVTNNNPCFRKAYSSDAFAIRPNDFNSTISGGQLFRAGEAALLTFRSDPFGATTGAVNYNETEGSSFVVDVNISDAAKSCHDKNVSFSPSISFTNGIVTNSYMLNNVGDFNLTMREKMGAEFAFVDADDTPDADRFIASYTQQIKVIPHHFTLDGNLTNGSNGFTYLSNFDGNVTLDRNVSALLDANITAKTSGGTTTTNYTNSCYAKSGNVSLAIAMPTVAPSGSLTKMLWYDDLNNTSHGNFTLNTLSTPLPYPALRFAAGDSNGTANIQYRLNFDRNQTKLVNPFMMTMNEVNATDTDLVDGNKTLTAANTAYYVYGRVIPRDIRVFGANTPFKVNAWYEVYNASVIGVTTFAPSKNESGWYINTLHRDLVAAYDGDANVTYTNATAVNIGGAVGADGVEDYNFGSTYGLGGYKAHINADPWLWYGVNASSYNDPSGVNLDCLTHPCFNINIVPPIGVTGSAKAETKSNKSNKTSNNAGGAGGWKSTTDYAPAIR